MINLRFGIFALLATSLINAVYQNSNSGVVSIALVIAGISLVFLGATFMSNVKVYLSNRMTFRISWIVVVCGVVLNILS